MNKPPSFRLIEYRRRQAQKRWGNATYLQWLRKRWEITPREMAKELEMTTKMYNRLEQGKRVPKPPEQWRLEAFFRKPWYELVRCL